MRQSLKAAADYLKNSVKDQLPGGRFQAGNYYSNLRENRCKTVEENWRGHRVLIVAVA